MQRAGTSLDLDRFAVSRAAGGTGIGLVDTGDPEVDGWRVELEQARRVDIERSVNAMVDREVDARTIDLLWVIFGPEIYQKLTNDVGLSR